MPSTHSSGPTAAGRRACGVCCGVDKERGSFSRETGALSLGTLQVINGVQLLAVFFPLVAGVALQAGGRWWEKIHPGVGNRVGVKPWGGYGQMLPPHTWQPPCSVQAKIPNNNIKKSLESTAFQLSQQLHEQPTSLPARGRGVRGICTSNASSAPNCRSQNLG